MDFEFTQDQLDFRDAARSVLASAVPASLVRAVYDATDPVTDSVSAHSRQSLPQTLWRTLCDLDWPGVGVAVEHGGLGLGFIEVGVLVEELGRVVAPSPFLATVTQYAPVVRHAGDGSRLAAVAAGDVTATLAIAERGRWDLDAVRATARRDAGGRWHLSGAKSHVFDAATAEVVAVVARSDDGLGVFAVPGSSLNVTPFATIDPTQPIGHVHLDGVEVGDEAVIVEPGDPGAAELLARVLDEATTAVCLSTVATCRTIFEMTVQYAKDREQFGQPIGSFQAIKHRLADCYLALERASAIAYYAALTIAEDDPRRAHAVSMAKSAVGDCQQLLTRDGLQLHGGVGFTWEHDLHFWLKRATVAELVFGTSAWHRSRLASLMGLAPARAAS